MIILSLRTDKPESEIGLFDDDKQLAHESWEAHRRLAETLHSKINDMLQSQKKSWEDIKGIVVYEGPGSFTGLRISITTANTLAYSNDAAVIGETGENWCSEGISKLLAGKNQKSIVPAYGGEAHITSPKK